VTHASFLFLHSQVALPLMRRTSDLATAYQYFEEADRLHVSVHARHSPEAIYNMACCLSLGAAAAAAAAHGGPAVDPAPGLPPCDTPAARRKLLAHDLVEARLDLAVGMLQLALGAGYASAANLGFDLDLAFLRQRRTAQLASLMRSLGETAAVGPPRLRVVMSATAPPCAMVPSVPVPPSPAVLSLPGAPRAV